MKIIYKIKGEVVSKEIFENHKFIDEIDNITLKSVINKIDKLLALKNEPDAIVEATIQENNSTNVSVKNINNDFQIRKILD